MGGLSIWHWLIVLLIVLVIFGTSRLKNVGGDLGKAIREFKHSMSGEDEKKPEPQLRAAAATGSAGRGSQSAAARPRGLLIVIPAKAGIQFFASRQTLDSRFRGNDVSSIRPDRPVESCSTFPSAKSF